jgi:hypothetical protein
MQGPDEDQIELIYDVLHNKCLTQSYLIVVVIQLGTIEARLKMCVEGKQNSALSAL